MAAAGLDVGMRCIKCLLVAVNALFVLTGMMIMSLGGKIYAVYEDFSRFLDPSYFSPASLLIVVGMLIIAIAVFGCCGALHERTCMVLVFAFFLSIVLVLEFAAAIAAYALRDGIKSLLEEKINDTMQVYATNQEAKDAIDFVQSKLHCCGYNGHGDWYSAPDMSGLKSCCPFPGEELFFSNGTCYEEGCIQRLSVLVNRSAFYIGTGATAIALMQLSGIMFACMLGRAIRRQKTERERRRWEVGENLVNGYQPLGKSDPVATYPVIFMPTPVYQRKDSDC